MPRDLHCLLHLCYHDIACSQGDIVRGVHGREGRRDDREIVFVTLPVEEGRICNSEANLRSFHILDLTEYDWIIMYPSSFPVVLEECVQKLACFQLRILLTHVGN